ncbi:hypothetical protein MUN46_011010 [Mesosutterella sp. AGMB02718]|uniref:Uncharacterized protein n=1 Tax=Mesosutterella faecium TaxID=2925194 RepID=A0ABT7IR62_9BURK|nr:hypothetical protein [Mesosutterella sp. AGMB02718]MDL2060465.1 hypothetical protein [Mesosutterella sp. AGMB02718]
MELTAPATLRIRDHGIELAIPFEACRLYHGEDSIGGLAFGYRLVCFALSKLSPGRTADRRDFRFKTAFPGPGVIDALEMTTRAVSRGALEVIPPESAPRCAPEAVYGRLYFEASLGDPGLCLCAREGIMSEDFIRTGRSVKAGGRDPALLAHWTELKRALARAAMAARDEELFAIVPEGGETRNA